MKNINKNLKEAKNDLVFDVVFVGGNSSWVEQITSKNYKNFDKIYKNIQNQFTSDDVWIDDIILVKGDKSLQDINWTELLGNFDNDYIMELVFEDVEFPIKAEFLRNYGYDIDEDSIEGVQVIYNPNYEYSFTGKEKYPEDFIEEWKENVYYDLNKALEKANAEYLFDWVRLIDTAEINGDFNSDEIGKYFVYTYQV